MGQPSAEMLALMDMEAERMHSRHEAAVAAAERRWARQVRVCAGELVRDGVTLLSLDTGLIRGRVVRFRRGDSVLELESVGLDPDRGGESWARLSRGQEADPDVFVGYLLQHVARLNDGEEPS